MKKKVFDDYYLGLDIGTDSVGWAVTDKNYNILNFNGKAMWGVHLFDPGNTAKDRRVQRTARRRLERRKQRIKLLQEIFSEEMDKVDPDFFKRLNESRLHIEDRTNKNHDTLFNDPQKTKSYFKKYPTIYHLRSALMETNEKPDIRHLYLACHHIIKYRGHFLFANLSSGSIPKFEEVFDELIRVLNQECGTEIESAGIGNDVKEILTNKRLGVNEKKRNLAEIIVDDEYPDTVKELCGLISGGTANLDKMFKADGEDLELKTLSFKNIDYDEKRTEYEDKLFEKIEILDYAKVVYDWTLLSDLLGEYHNISKAKVASYEQHGNDLKLLKSLLNGNREKYKEVFKAESKSLSNYTAYSKNYQKNDSESHSCTQSDFCKYLRAVLKEELAQPEFIEKYPDFVERLKDDTFMPKQKNKDNSLFPNALHIHELETILSNASKHYSFLNEKDETGLSPTDKIKKLGTFRIPYYVGPLSLKTSRSWLVRKENGLITPWNFENKVDLDESGNEFINRLIGNCTYLPAERVVPKSSLMYQRFMLYNELNTLKINGERLFELNLKLKHEMVKDLFEKPGLSKVTKKKIETYLKQRSLLNKDDEIELSGVDNDIKSSLKSEMQLKEILGPDMDRNMAEDIVRTITVFGDEKSRVEKKLKKDYPDKLTDDQIKKLSNLRFKDWGRLSEKFLTQIYAPVKGKDMSILEALENTSLNLMELLSKDYNFEKEINELNEANASSSRITYNLVENLYVSPPVKRGIWRTLRIIEDILKVTGRPPAKVFIETIRENQESKRTDSRKKKLEEAYKKCSEGNGELIEALNKEDESRLRRKDLFLYYMQQGKCMYCEGKIDLNDLISKSSRCYEIDHIHPRSLKMDDSIHNNLVLVCSEHNQEKGKEYPLKPEWQKERKPFWGVLKDKGFITKEKYERLTRITEFENDELGGFINRQLVETSQSVKAVAQLLDTVFENKTEVVYVKANTVSDFRNGNNGFRESDSDEILKFIKCRSVNDYHHAKDAYLNIVVGNVYNTKFTKDPRNFISGGGRYNLRTLFAEDVKRGDVHAWTKGPEGTIATVQKYMRRNNILFTKLAYQEKGALFDLNPVKKGKGQLPLKKELSIEKYGGYNKLAGSYYSLVEYTKNKKKIRIIYPILTHLANEKADESEIIRHLETEGIEEPRILIQKIPKFSMFEIDDFRLHISGRTGDSIIYYTAEQLILPELDYVYCKKLENYIEKSKETKLRAESYGLTIENNKRLYQTLIEKCEGPKYNNWFGTLGKVLSEKSNIFEKLSLDEQSYILNQILHRFQCNATYPNLKYSEKQPFLKEIDIREGVIEIRKNRNVAANINSIKLIHQSPSGLFEKETNLKGEL